MQAPVNSGSVQLGVSLGRSLPVCDYLGLQEWRINHSCLSEGGARLVFIIVLSLSRSKLNISKAAE